MVLVENTHYNITDSPKTENRWLGPFKVVGKIGEVNYKLQLPRYLLLHPVFHCSRLTRFRSETAFVHPPQPYPLPGSPKEIEVILGHRRGQGRGGPLSFSVKYRNEPLPDTPIWLTLPVAKALSPSIVDEYCSHIKVKPSQPEV